jgi:uncharacterized protein
MQTTAKTAFSNPPRVVIDTNALLVSISSRSATHILFSAFQRGEYILCCSNEIIEEYAKIIARLWNDDVASSVIKSLLHRQNLRRVETYYRWHLIVQDADDDKFVDCAVAASADCIVTDDAHYDILTNIDFPKVNVMKLEQFCEFLFNHK